jgi:hypothetical protein
MMTFRPLIGVLALWTLTTIPASSQESAGVGVDSVGQTEVLVLGVWHMTNFTGDDRDILSPQRQAELLEVLSALQEFQPTKIAVEQVFYRGDDLGASYASFLEGAHELTRNEVHQIGFRLARRLGHETVYAIDANGDFPLPGLQDYVQARGHQEGYEAVMQRWERTLEAWDTYFTAHTLLETLLYMNSDEYATEVMAHDYELAHFGEPWNWAGPDLLAAWFRRNIRIYGNVVHLADSPNEKVLVVIGNGHLAWLRHSFDSDPGIRLRNLAEFVH